MLKQKERGCKMNIPPITYYAVFELNTPKGNKTPKYTIVSSSGYYPPMHKLKGRDGQISMYLMEKLKEGLSVPAMRLQAKGGLNFTGLKDYFEDGKISGYAYGNPYERETFGKEEKANPFFKHKDDCFLFQMHDATDSEGKQIVKSFELIVLSGRKSFGAAFCKALQQGCFDEALRGVREQMHVY